MIISINYYDYKMLLFSRQGNILYILDTTILMFYRKLYINIVSIIVLDIEVRQYNIKINLAISCSPSKVYKISVLKIYLMWNHIIVLFIFWKDAKMLKTPFNLFVIIWII